MYQKPLRSDELMHYGVPGMKWGVRRYQPYSTTGPRKSGEKGKEIGTAKKRRRVYEAMYKHYSKQAKYNKAELTGRGKTRPRNRVTDTISDMFDPRTLTDKYENSKELAKEYKNRLKKSGYTKADLKAIRSREIDKEKVKEYAIKGAKIAAGTAVVIASKGMINPIASSAMIVAGRSASDRIVQEIGDAILKKR